MPTGAMLCERNHARRPQLPSQRTSRGLLTHREHRGARHKSRVQGLDWLWRPVGAHNHTDYSPPYLHFYSKATSLTVASDTHSSPQPRLPKIRAALHNRSAKGQQSPHRMQGIGPRAP